MAKSRRNSGGCTRGRYKRKKMGKGWASARRMPVVVKPKTGVDTAASDGGGDAGKKA